MTATAGKIACHLAAGASIVVVCAIAVIGLVHVHALRKGSCISACVNDIASCFLIAQLSGMMAIASQHGDLGH